MTPADLLRVIRSKGYSLSRDGAELAIAGPTPRDPVRAKVAIDANRDAWLAILDAEQSPAVRSALEVFGGGRVIDVRSPRRIDDPLPGDDGSQKQGLPVPRPLQGGPKTGRKAGS